LWDIHYRPLKFADVLGQDGNVQLLKSRLKNKTVFDTSYIFAGPFGCGKTTLSRILARAMLCQDLDKDNLEPCNKCDNCTTILEEQPGPFVERDAASQGTIEHIRAIIEELPYVLINAPKRIYLFDEAHRMSMAAQDVLLKPIEDKKMIGMFCTTEAEKIRGAIRSRCEEYTIRKITKEDILKRMRVILESEKVEYQDDAILIIIDHSGRHVRDVINKLEMISQLGPITVNNVRDYLHLSVITLYYKILLSLDNPVQAIELVDQACEQVAPEEVSAGLAEAAMNTYRVANGMHADFSFVDKELAGQIYNKYQANVVKFAYWFLGSRYASKLSLTRDIVVFSQTPGNLPLDNPTPPVVFAGQTVLQQPVAQKVVVSSSVNTPSPSSSPPPMSQFADADFNVTRPTEVEASLVNTPLPRVRNERDVVVLPRKAKTKQMTPEEWRRIFERFLKKTKQQLLQK
jgi:DNA polymerase III subunit gamma/tau